MPQLDIYTFPTQLYTLGVLFFFGFLWTIKFLLISFFKIELLEKEEVYTLDTIFLIQTSSFYRPVSTMPVYQLLGTLTQYPVAKV